MKETLSNHEWVIMEALWAHHPLFLSELQERTETQLPWKRSTYMTYLKRMCEKGYIGFEEVRGSRAYRPLLERGACVDIESRSMLSKMTDDSRRLFLTCMIRESGLTQEDSQDLKQLIDALTGEMEK